ncbi:RGCVC family protein [Rhodococcus opacus]|nr:RGCVC family protein [Rhodococcus opacus]MDV6245136.1 RGCVC family protein [Rhodococcus opacus]MDV7088868.1 RGCVC family protein [Rhodococcus opacus]
MPRRRVRNTPPCDRTATRQCRQVSPIGGRDSGADDFRFPRRTPHELIMYQHRHSHAQRSDERGWKFPQRKHRRFVRVQLRQDRRGRKGSSGRCEPSTRLEIGSGTILLREGRSPAEPQGPAGTCSLVGAEGPNMRGQAMSSSAPDPARCHRAENWSAAMASNATYVSNPERALESTPSCTACPHSPDSHDALGIRFCAATSDRNLDRNCICAGEQATGQHYSRY